MQRVGPGVWIGLIVGAMAVGACSNEEAEETEQPVTAVQQESADESMMKSDLRNLLVQQEVYFAEHMTYSMDFAALGATLGPGVTIRLQGASDSGWAAVAVHTDSELRCAIAVGVNANPIDSTAAMGEPVCR